MAVRCDTRSSRARLIVRKTIPIPGERTLLSSDGNKLAVTTRRVRLMRSRAGSSELVSITLDAIASCRITFTSHPALVGVGAASAVFGYIEQTPTDGSPIFYGLGAALVLVVAYFVTRKQVLEVASRGGSKIVVPVKGIPLERTLEIVDTIEDARLALKD